MQFTFYRVDVEGKRGWTLNYETPSYKEAKRHREYLQQELQGTPSIRITRVHMVHHQKTMIPR